MRLWVKWGKVLIFSNHLVSCWGRNPGWAYVNAESKVVWKLLLFYLLPSHRNRHWRQPQKYWSRIRNRKCFSPNLTVSFRPWVTDATMPPSLRLDLGTRKRAAALYVKAGMAWHERRRPVAAYLNSPLPCHSKPMDGWFVYPTRLSTNCYRKRAKLTFTKTPLVQSWVTNCRNFVKVASSRCESASGVCVSPKWPLTAWNDFQQICGFCHGLGAHSHEEVK